MKKSVSIPEDWEDGPFLWNPSNSLSGADFWGVEAIIYFAVPSRTIDKILYPFLQRATDHMQVEAQLRAVSSFCVASGAYWTPEF